MNVLQLFLVIVITSCLFTYVVYVISMYKMQKEKHRNLIMCDLIKLESDSIDLLNSINLRDFPMIEKQIREISLILDRLSYDACISKIKLVRIKDDAKLMRDYELLERERKRLGNEEVNTILFRRTLAINSIAKYNFPIIYCGTIIKNMILQNHNDKIPKSFEKKNLQYKVA
jgi:hypothetical protein